MLVVVLDSFLVPLNLMFNPIQREVHGRHQIFVLVLGYKVVLVFSIDFDFNFLVDSIREIDQNFDHRNAVEKMQELVGFLTDVLLVRLVEVPVTGGNCYLHSRLSPWSRSS